MPAAAIQRSPQTTFVYAVKADSTVEMRPVEVTLTEGEEAAIGKGIAPGEVVVVEGVDRLQPGSKVALNAPGKSPQGGAGSPRAPSSGSPRKTKA